MTIIKPIKTPPGGADTQVQFNNAGEFGGSANFTFDGDNTVLSGKHTAARYDINDANTYITEDGSSNMTFTDAVTGTKTLAELAAGGGGVGDVTAAANLTDNTLIRGDGGAKGIQDSSILVDDSDNVTGMGTLGCGAITSTGAVEGTSLTDGTMTITGGAAGTLTVDLASNTLTGTIAEFNTACSDQDFAYSGGAFHDGFSDYVAGEHFLQSAITEVGTIATGVWQGTAIDGAYVDIEGTEIKSTGEGGGTKFLREDGDGTCSWQTVAGGSLTIGDAITGGAANRILFEDGSNQLAESASLTFTGTAFGCDGSAVFNESGADKDFRVESSAGTHSFFVQGSDGFVGINCVPSYQLMISNSAATQFAIHRDANSVNNSAKFLLCLDDSAGNITEYAGVVGQIIDNTNGSEDGRLGFQTMLAGTRDTRATIENDGNVHILTDGAYTKWGAGQSSGVTDTGSNMELDYDLNNSSRNFIIKENGVERARFDTNGYFGIGTDSPAYTLQVTNSAATQFAIHRDTNLVNSSAKFLLCLNGGAGNITEYAGVVGQIVDNTYGSEDGRIGFQTMLAGTRDTRVTIENDGDMHFLNDGQSAKWGEAQDCGIMFLTDMIVDYDLKNSGTTDFRIQENGTDRFVITTGGAVDVAGDFTAGTIQADDGWTGTFTNGDGDTVTVTGGIITDVS